MHSNLLSRSTRPDLLSKFISGTFFKKLGSFTLTVDNTVHPYKFKVG